MADKKSLAWARTLLEKGDFGDKRRNARASEVLTAIVAHPGDSLAQAAQGSNAATERFYRFSRDSKVDPSKLLSAACLATADDINQDDSTSDLLIITDSTTLSYRHSASSDLGPMGHVQESVNRGWIVHTALAVDADTSATRGILDQIYWTRDQENHGKWKTRKERDYKDKESYKWELSAGAVVAALGADIKRAVFVTDRESDVFEYLDFLRTNECRFIVRSSPPRRIEQSQESVRKHLEAQDSLCLLHLKLAQKGGRPARVVMLETRTSQVTLKSPATPTKSFEPITLNAILLSETNTPENTEPLSWLLYTSDPVTSVSQAVCVVRRYSRRWRIEEFHKVWKSDGTNVERLRLQTPDNLLRVAALKAFAACRIMSLRDTVVAPLHLLTHVIKDGVISEIPPQGVLFPDNPCVPLLSQDQWVMLWVLIEKKKFPDKVPSRRWASLAMARLGGWLDTKNTGRPGYKAYMTGCERLYRSCNDRQAAIDVDFLAAPGWD